ncbi:MAG: M23 family metallopeptidase [Bauldia sp.]|nr:M23 family metallopeptidase [Bauldia sp.]
MHRTISLALIVVFVVAGAILAPARANDTIPAAGNADAARVALPDGAATANVAPDEPAERPRWLQRIGPFGERQALIVQPLLGGQLTSEFGVRRHPLLGTNEMHDGVDWAAPRGTFVFAAADGTVSFAGWDSGYGNTVRITHSDGVETVYAHLSRIGAGVEPGAVVIQGFVVGEVGSTGMTTGPNLHFEVHLGGIPVDPLGVGETLLVTAMDRQLLARIRAQ